MKVAYTLVSFIASQAVVGLLAHRDVATVERDLSLATANLTALDTTLHNFVQGGSSLVQALNLHTESSSSLNAIDTTISDIKTMGVTLTSTDGSSVENTVASMQATVIDICETFSQNIGVIGSAAPNIKSLLQQDISNLLTAFDSLLIILHDSTTDSVSSDIASLKLQFENTCNPVVAPVKPGSA